MSEHFFTEELRVLDKEQYVHIFVVGLLFAAFDAYGIGSNDVANAFATSVGAKSLSLKMACFIALFTEFIGAITLGAEVADTIKGKILDINDFKGQSDCLMLGMFCSSIGSSVWVNTASYIGMPVSTTHATVGATIGVGIAFGGKEAVEWGYCEGGDCFGVLAIVVSWGLSPALAGCFASAVYLFTKYVILVPGGEVSFWRARMCYPLYIGLTWAVLAFFMILKGAPELNEEYEIYEKKGSKKEIKSDKLGPVFGFAFGVGAFFAIIAAVCVNNQKFIDWANTPYVEPAKKEKTEEEKNPPKLSIQSFKNFVNESLEKDVLTIDAGNIGGEMAQTAHDVGVQYYEPTEKVFMAVQVFTAAFASLAHGANDVANAIAPLCTVYYVWRTGYPKIGKKVPVETWILAFGGIWIDIGLTFSGWRIMKNLGNNITYHSPSRGFCMELGALTTVLYASQQGKPVSTTHCITGATVGVGICNGDARSINWLMVGWAMFGWVITLPCAGIVAGMFFAFVSKSPKVLARYSQTTILKLNYTTLTSSDQVYDAADGMFDKCYVESACNNVRVVNDFHDELNM
mmetsp:Transcript_33231/g.46038  ORF Transcript_33231/g.46038 Transcript_33231/m.46038 type:complete len:572 (-) Transcript_33231:124-1839(-)|eukprot:CAMPEP_0196579704 /NCGR_PEP_ID=MMETSP1081-20130531/24457_1 /TAXON_ID=36882 /ORGANISM="Pyramimonas amylifera, Strain CCMP720" /LENGTH=571 /DNA_ID=CAMNT_0041899363 /DNA_START=96 /DNA_END=1811 /DNA_ORIENTATION=+